MTHKASYRVHYEDTDMAGVVYYANYLKFIERARSDALREAGVDQRAMRDEGRVFVVTRVEADYLSPARYDDIIVVETGLEALRGASATLRQIVTCGERTLFRALVSFACMSVEGRPSRLPGVARKALSAL
ncbi:MAG: YbgC/FadM family acyl-CoA thioesterase [Pikeienuella sp.]